MTEARPSVDSATAFLAATPGVARVGDAAVSYRRMGTGAPLVLLHGWPLWGFTFHRLVSLLADTFDCIVPDLPGAGNTAWSANTDFSFEARARLVGELIEALGITDYWLLGQDTGATVARLVVTEHPGTVKGLILLNTEMPGHRPPWVPFYQRLLGLPGATLCFQALLRWRLFTRSSMGFGGCFTDEKWLEGSFREHNLLRMARDRGQMQGQIRILRAIDWRTVDALSQTHTLIECPTILIWGEDDPTFPIDEARRMVGEFPSAELIAVPEAKLLVHEERPEDVARAIRGFVSGVEG